jgi:hypothetical protein
MGGVTDSKTKDPHVTNPASHPADLHRLLIGRPSRATPLRSARRKPKKRAPESYGVFAIAAVCWHWPKLFFTEATSKLIDATAALAPLPRDGKVFTWRDRFACQLLLLLAIVGSERLTVARYAPHNVGMPAMQRLNHQSSCRGCGYGHSDLRAVSVTMVGSAIRTCAAYTCTGTATSTSVLSPGIPGRRKRQHNHPSSFRDQS